MTTQDREFSWTEAERLEALTSYAILDTPPEEDFDDLARMAATLLGTSVAAINLIAEGRHWFKAKIGLGVREASLNNSICSRMLFDDGP